MFISFDCIQYISKYVDLKTQIRIKLTCSKVYSKIYIPLYSDDHIFSFKYLGFFDVWVNKEETKLLLRHAYWKKYIRNIDIKEKNKGIQYECVYYWTDDEKNDPKYLGRTFEECIYLKIFYSKDKVYLYQLLKWIILKGSHTRDTISIIDILTEIPNFYSRQENPEIGYAFPKI